MRFFIDACLPREFALLLGSYGHTSIDARDIGMGRADDTEIADHRRPTSTSVKGYSDRRKGRYHRSMPDYASRAGLKLEHALRTFAVDVTGLTCADLGSNVGGFVDCLLQHGAAKVYAIEKGYGVLEWKLRKDPRVIVMERTNAMHVTLPEKVDLVTIDVAWTRQRYILPAARKLLRETGRVVTLIKPHYEADKRLLRKGILPPEKLDDVLEQVKQDIAAAGFQFVQSVASPILGSEGNAEVLAELRPA